ncbi:MAG: AAA family ATPase [Ignavibacteriales bacterium]|nr:AAA family ATPase [Ignavibacteriales bacterium]
MNTQETKNEQPCNFFAESFVDYHYYDFGKTYLYNLFTGNLHHPTIQVFRMLGNGLNESYRLKHILSLDRDGLGGVFVFNDSIEATVYWSHFHYEVVLTKFIQHGITRFLFSVYGMKNGADKPMALINELLREATRHSSVANKFLKVKFVIDDDDHTDVALDIQLANIVETSLNEIFLPLEIKEPLELYIDCIKEYHRFQKPLRYLLSGKPGTAKTKIIRAIANEVKGKATFIFKNGSEGDVNSVFSFAESFSPAVICIDDVDLLAGDRRDGRSQKLAEFLQHLDGFIGNNVFVLATTNDKTLVDIAASRPGRFDMILDVSPIKSNHYLQLVENKCSLPEIVSLFDDEVLEALERKNVTGAFLVNLVKHLELVMNIGKKIIDREYVLHTLGKLNSGFYKEPEPTNGKVGFEMM